MVGCKAEAGGAMIDQQADMHKEIRVAAGANALEIMFEPVIADHISKGNGDDEKEDPPGALCPEIEQGKHDQE